MLRICVSSEVFSCNLELEHEITLLGGDSASGKSILVDFLVELDPFSKIICDLPIVLLSESNWKPLVITSSNSLLITDDEAFVMNPEFFEEVVRCNGRGNYYLIIVRSIIFDVIKLFNYPVSLDAFLVLEKSVANITEKIVLEDLKQSLCILYESGLICFQFKDEFINEYDIVNWLYGSTEKIKNIEISNIESFFAVVNVLVKSPLPFVGLLKDIVSDMHEVEIDLNLEDILRGGLFGSFNENFLKGAYCLAKHRNSIFEFKK